MSIVEPIKRTPVIGKYDVIVAGGGPAGTGAAIAAARAGANTLLIERYGFLGGMYTAGYVLGIHVDKTVPLKEYKEERTLIGGILDELVEKLIDMRGLIPPKEWAKYLKGHNPADPEMMKIALMEMVEDAGAKQLLHAFIVNTVVKENEVKGVIIESKSGRQAVLADVVVDCTGDGDVAFFAGAPWEKGPRAKEKDMARHGQKGLLAMSLFTILGGVDIEKAKEHGIYRGGPGTKEVYKKAREEGFRDAYTNPPYPPEAGIPSSPPSPKLPLEFWGMHSLPPDLVKKYWQRKDEAMGVNYSYWGDCTDVRDLTEAEIYTRKQILPALDFLRKHVPGYENCFVAATSPQIGLRESRRIMGGYVLTYEKDIKNCLKHDDVICQGRPMFGPAFDVPYRCLVPKKLDGLLTAGRCISLSHSAARIIAMRDEQQAMALGQASGAAAALCVRERVEPRDLNVQALQDLLREQGLNVPKR